MDMDPSRVYTYVLKVEHVIYNVLYNTNTSYFFKWMSSIKNTSDYCLQTTEMFGSRQLQLPF